MAAYGEFRMAAVNLAMGGRPRQRLRQTSGGHPLTGRVTTPDPKAPLQGVTSKTK